LSRYWQPAASFDIVLHMESQTKINLTNSKTTVTPVDAQQDAALAASMERTSMSRKKVDWFKVGIAVAIVFGLGTGYVVAAVTKPPEVLELATVDSKGVSQASDAIKVGQVFGSKDAAAFKDSAEGVILPGGIDNEGSHHLVRAGGPSQNVYLTSSVVDLKLFENAKVKIYGETFKGRKAGWLMDVGRVEVQELNATLPDWVIKEQQKTVKPGTDE
jgi:hypothetical protein